MTQARTGAADVASAMALAMVLAASFLAIDLRAEAAFDAPKRLIALGGTVAVSIALLLGRQPAFDWRWGDRSRTARITAVLVGAFLLLSAISAAVSPRPEAAWHGLRVLVLSALLLPIGASRVLAGRRGAALLTAFVVAACASAAMVSSQALGWWAGVNVESFAGRSSAVALVGNEGVLALALILAVLSATTTWLYATTTRLRLASIVAAAVLLGGVLSIGNLTSIAALLLGLVVLMALGSPHRALAAAAAIAIGAAVVTSAPQVKTRLGEITAAPSDSGRAPAASGRLAAWAAALEMVRERPLTGYGPATFAAEFADHRVAAELRMGRRLVHPTVTSTFAEAHNELLQAAAELGIPTAVAALAAFGTLVWSMGASFVRSARSRSELVLLATLLVAGTVAAVMWFPLQRPVTCVPLLLAAGRAWRLAGESG